MASRLDLKYRPRKFSEVLGNEGVVDLLLKRSRADTLSNQSMLFGGPKGTGKTTLARIVAMAIVCENKTDGEPCGACRECLAVLNETSTSVEELDAASQGTVDRIRDMIHDSEYEPIGGIGNIYILDEAQRLSLASQDAMLKAVEDRSILVIMCTTEPHKIRASIRSRVEEYPISAPSTEAIASRLVEICEKEQIQFEKDALTILCEASQNCPRICIRAIETLSVSGGVTTDAAKKFMRFDSYDVVNKILALIDDHPKSAIDMFDELIDREGPTWVRDAMLFAVASGIRMDVGAGHKYPCRLTFFQSRLRGWAEFARQIGIVEKPTSAGILASLISTKPSFSPKPTKTRPDVSEPPPIPKPDVPKIPEKTEEVSGKPTPLEIDGIKFSPAESLTTLDSKITPSAPVEQPLEVAPSVEFRSDMQPMSDREFARDFISRFKR